MLCRPELVGKTFAEAVFMFKDAIPCGLRRRQLSRFGRRIHVNPHPDTVIEASSSFVFCSQLINALGKVDLLGRCLR
jgi:hypothetical protein